MVIRCKNQLQIAIRSQTQYIGIYYTLSFIIVIIVAPYELNIIALILGKR